MSAEEGEVSDGQIHSDGGLVRVLLVAAWRGEQKPGPIGKMISVALLGCRLLLHIGAQCSVC